MNNYELYLDGQLMEMEDKFSFGLVYQSPIFTDISKIVSNRTSTIKLPLTANNMRVIESCQMPDNTTKFPYEIHKVELWNNGLPIIQRGVFIVLEISEYIESTFIWGNISNIKSLMDAKLRELKFPEDYLLWSSTSPFMTTVQLFGFILIDYGQGLEIKYTHPVVSLLYLLKRMKEQFKIKIEHHKKYKELFSHLFIPLVEKNPNEKTFERNVSSFTIDVNHDVVILPNGNLIGVISSNSFIAVEDGSMYFEGTFYIKSKASFLNSDFKFVMRFYKNNTRYTYLTANLEYQYYIDEFNNEIEYWESKVTLTKQKTFTDVKKGDKLTIGLRFYDGIHKPGAELSEASGDLDVHLISKTVPFLSIFPIIPNLPDISCLDALKNIMLLFGLFAYYDENKENTIKLFSIDELYANKSKAKNWTDKLVTGNQLESIKYTFQDYAQRNWIRYLKDETVNVDADGYIEVDNKTLAREKELAELKFAASEMRNGFAYIPIYTKDEKGEIKHNKLNPRVLDSGKYYPDTNNTNNYFIKGTFSNAMSFDGNGGRIAMYYSKYQSIILRPKVVAGTFHLKELDLYKIDMLTPIYLEQTGRYYAIISIQETDGKAKVELLQM